MKTYKSTIILIGLLTLFSLFFAACGSTPSGPNQVHMNDSNFTQDSITIKKGETITLVNDTMTAHIIENGTWDTNGNAKSGQEAGAPKVDYNVGGYANQSVGPFNTAGTFEIYCTIHPSMKFTIIVQ
ncbi:cupredoxin domain-containing protein [Tengunoibacter tsumagoiensis]|uniref:Blue (type 1) copper domain-containing protein n=1 Tax=Tengunoibacter tsumagoiensis TaxID=2014871 RepID=A0A401ZXK8_9CHLR|nr:plastocyanin/azurin family copper-binding protein [Tengunoibacter tsumagoiensis]GCE11572.1 hypothetical protein KTT_14310 [Tengunoibacter tsumagoiensis]